MPVFQDLRYALRSLRTHPGFTTAAVTTLALGIAVNTIIFSFVNSVLLRSLPYPDADRLALLWTTAPNQSRSERPTGFLTVNDWEQQARSLSELLIFRDEPVVLAEPPEPESVDASFVSPGLFVTLGVQTILGRTFTPDEAERGERLVVLSYALWQRRFAGSRDAIGKLMRIDGKPAQVIGVLPAGFRPLNPGTQLWMPYSAVTYFEETRTSRSGKFGWNVLAKLRSGVHLEDVGTEMNGILSRLAQSYPADYAGAGVRVVSLHEQITGQVRLPMQLLFAAVVAVLLIACTNLGNLVLARGVGRVREISIRTALGAGRGRLVSQLLIESLVLSILAGILGLLLTDSGLRGVLAFAPKSIPRLDEVALDARAVLFTGMVSIVSAILFGLAPALRLASGGLASGSRVSGGGRPARRTRDLLVVTEFALAMILLAAAGLLVRSMIGILGVDPGYQTSILTVGLHPAGIADDAARFAQLVERLEALPGIQAAGGISRYFQANLQRAPILIEGRPALTESQWQDVNYDVTAGHYLQALGVPLLRGRYFQPRDSSDSPKVVMVNDAFVKQFLGGEEPIGKRFRRGGDPVWYTIVGVMGDMRRQTLTRAPVPEVLWPHSQRPWGMGLVVRAPGDPLALAATVRRAIHTQDPTAVITGISTLDRQLDDKLAQRRFQTWLLGVFAALALVLAAIGIYGLMHYDVTERVQEIGIRVALGAQPRNIFGLVLRHAARLACVGIALGLIGALWLTRALATLLYGVSAHDPVTYAGVAMLLAGVAGAASVMPARRATRSDPLTALRHD